MKICGIVSFGAINLNLWTLLPEVPSNVMIVVDFIVGEIPLRLVSGL